MSEQEDVLKESYNHPVATQVHVAAPRVLATVFAALIVLTGLTVAVSYFDFGAMNLFVAVGVATVKATLVALYFMHLRYDSLLYSILFLIGVAFLGLFLSVTLLDTIEYQPQVEMWQQQNVP